MEGKDTANIGLSADMHMKLHEMNENGVFNEMKDGYRLAASLAIKLKLQVEDHTLQDRKNMYDVGGVDDNFLFRNTISLLYPENTGLEYKYLEKLADKGMAILYEKYEETGSLDLADILRNDA